MTRYRRILVFIVSYMSLTTGSKCWAFKNQVLSKVGLSFLGKFNENFSNNKT